MTDTLAPEYQATRYSSQKLETSQLTTRCAGDHVLLWLKQRLEMKNEIKK